MKKRNVRWMILLVSLILCACANQSPSPETAPTSAPMEESAKTVAMETEPEQTEPTETVPPETEPTFVTVNGISYDSRLGEPVLEEEAAKQLAGQNPADAAGQITNVGDALHYMQFKKFNDTADLYHGFAALLAYDYDEIGFIILSSQISNNIYIYIEQDGVFYPMNPVNGVLWPEVPSSDTDLNRLCQLMMTTCPFTQEGEPMTEYGAVALYSHELIQIKGVSYAAEFGEPVLGEEAVKALVSAGDVGAAAEQINNVGDAIYYMLSEKTVDMPYDDSKLFAYLLTEDYPEVGLITLTAVDNSYTYVYIEQDGMFYYFDPFRFKKDDAFWTTAPKSAGDLEVLSQQLMTSFPFDEPGKPMTYYRTEALSSNIATPERDAIVHLTTCQYTWEELKAGLKENLTLDQWAEKIKVPADAVQLLRASNYGFKNNQPNGELIRDEANGAYWSDTWEAQDSFGGNSGNCEAIANIMNYLLAGDFEEQGYVQFNHNTGGHIFNYFVHDGVYVMCDFNCLADRAESLSYPNTRDYIVYAGNDVQVFGNWYRTKGYFAERFNGDPDDEEYLYHLWLYPREGISIPKGFDEQSKPTPFDNTVWDLLPEQYRELFVILFEREDTPLRFRPMPPMEQWPETIK